MINIYYRDSHLQGRMSGPMKVIQNLERSLNDCGVEYSLNEERYDKNLILHWDAPHIQRYHSLRNKDKLLVGPQIWPFAPDFYELKEYTSVLVPSKWCEKSYEKFFPETKTSIWPVAIYAPEVSGTPTTDCLIYHKNRSNEDLAYVKQLLSDRRLTYTQLQYGSYSQDDFRQALSSVRFCIIIDNTESQGIAIGEMMAAGKPLFVWDQPVWDHLGEQYKIDATTVPYWDDMCGEKTTERSELSNLLDKFLSKRTSYTPAEYIDRELSPEKTIKTLLDLYV